MQPIYDQGGKAVAWLQANHIYHHDGSHAAFVRGINVHGHAGQHLGVFRDGFFRDHAGDCVAFVAGARGGPSQPTRARTPSVPVPGAAPPLANFAIPPTPAVPTYTWSRLTWHGFLRSEQGLVSEETIRWPTKLDRKGIEQRLLHVRESAQGRNLTELASLFADVESMTAAEIGASVVAALTWLQERPEHGAITKQLEMVAMNLKNLK